MDADPNFGGVAVYDSYDDPTARGTRIGGTSLATPCWAGMIAIADQGRVLAGGTTLNGAQPPDPAGALQPPLLRLQRYRRRRQRGPRHDAGLRHGHRAG